MGLFNFINKVVAVTRHDLLSEQLARNKAHGLDDLQAGGLLIAQSWSLPKTREVLERSLLLSRNLGDLVIGLLIFSNRIGLTKAMKAALADDIFFTNHGCLYETAVPLTGFTRKYMNRIWDHERVDPADVSDAGFAAYYATLIAPFAVDAWLMLGELKQLGFCPKIDTRDHVKDGLFNTRKFLAEVKNADPEFCRLLTEGITHLRRMGQTRSV